MATTWVDSNAASGLGGAMRLSPVGAAMQAYEDAIHADPATDARLLELVAARASILLGGTSTPDGPRPQTPREEAAVAFAEQWLMDASGMTDELCAELRRHLGDEGAVAFTYGLSVVEAMTRLSLALGVAG